MESGEKYNHLRLLIVQEELKMIVSNVNERNGYKGPLKVIDDCDKLCSLSQNKGLER